ncbi:nocardicin N-oxygenase [Actinomadura coerulea]|uniref:Nocardicin N-oxygenase n=1 Tax=Actinomadura coerulea TaxID=46159 RepID=A0A7X0FUY3_9ACTN|nr:cytochrome P450 [Actinomadura coerulea]MBB6394167.1 nocardicin N-oxygenase [Actinomadura coerulea]GGQ20632.1 cytochrome P450 [Actinomadura coerulea]
MSEPTGTDEAGGPSPAPPPINDVRTPGPVVRARMLSGDVGYAVTRAAEAQHVLCDPAFSSAATFLPRAPAEPREPVGSSRVLFEMDPPEHTRLRRAVAQAFNRRRVEAMGAGIEEVVDGLLDETAAAGPPADLVQTLCAPLPLTDICELLGVPREDRYSFRGWAETIMALRGHSPREIDRARAAIQRYFADLVAARRADPADDLVSELLTARDREERITEAELVRLAITLLIAGHGPTMNQLARSVYALLTRPEMYAALHRDPELVTTAVEELLRTVPSVPVATPRLALRDVEIGGVPIPAGSTVAVSSLAANRDPALFTDPEVTDLGRTENRHLTFGYGPHFCVGAQLARTELRTALAALTRRFPDLRLAVPPEAVRWRTDSLFHGPVELPVTW